MRNTYRIFILGFVCLLSTAWAGTFGTAVPIGGQAIDLALDESRGVLYVANFTANRVEVISVADNSLVRSINVASQPSSVALSPDNKFLVITHYGAFAAPLPSSNGITVIDLETNTRQTFVLGPAPFGASFGVANQAFVATSLGFYLFDPRSGAMLQIASIPDIKARALPEVANTYPLQITTASLGTSRDGTVVVGLTENLEFVYNTITGGLDITSYVSSPVQAPRVVSVNQDGSRYVSGWALNDGSGRAAGSNLISQFRNATGDLAIGSHAYDGFRNLIYASLASPAGSRANPTLQILDAENLAVYERLNLPESLSGKSVLNSDNSVMYSISESGIMVLPVGTINQSRRIRANQEDVVFRGNFCNKQIASQEILIEDRSGAASDFTITSSNPGVRVSPASGTTPARVRLTVDPNSFLNQKGTSAVTLTITSGAAVNKIDNVRVLVNNREPDQLGTFVNVPGTLVDILADPDRDRYYVLRQDKNQVLVFDATTNTQFATLKTGNTPTQLAMSFDRKYLMIGGDDTQWIWVYDLDTLRASEPVRMPGGHYPKSIASAGGAILVANRVAGPVHKIDRVDLASRTATEFPTLGVFKNDVSVNTVLVASQNGSSVMAAMADGTMMLYSASADTFTISRKNGTALSGAYAASNYDQFVIGNSLLNASLVPVGQLDADGAKSSGFAFVDRAAIRMTAADAASAGLIQRFETVAGNSKSNRTIEAPVFSDVNPLLPFIRTIAPLPRRNSIVALTTSGLTVLPWNFDTPIGAPRVDQVVNLADFTNSLAPGSLIAITGANLSTVTQGFTTTTSALGDSCILLNGTALPILLVSPTQINAQLPSTLAGNATLRIATPGGILDNYTINTTTTAPAIFRTTVPGITEPVPSVVRASNGLQVTPSNPVHRGDVLTIYATGLGATLPNFTAGVPASNSLVSVAIPPRVTLGGVEVQVLFAGLAPGQIGVYQINVKVYDNVPLGFSLPLEISQGGNSTSVSVRVVE